MKLNAKQQALYDAVKNADGTFVLDVVTVQGYNRKGEKSFTRKTYERQWGTVLQSMVEEGQYGGDSNWVPGGFTRQPVLRVVERSVIDTERFDGKGEYWRKTIERFVVEII